MGLRLELGEDEAPSPKGFFPGLERESQAQTGGGRAGVQAGQVKDPSLGGEYQEELERTAEVNPGPSTPASTFLFPKRALTTARRLRTRQAH